jgi:hypothetical protein
LGKGTHEILGHFHLLGRSWLQGEYSWRILLIGFYIILANYL